MYSMFRHMCWQNLNSITLLKIVSWNWQMIFAFNTFLVERARARLHKVLSFYRLDIFELLIGDCIQVIHRMYCIWFNLTYWVQCSLWVKNRGFHQAWHTNPVKHKFKKSSYKQVILHWGPVHSRCEISTVATSWLFANRMFTNHFYVIPDDCRRHLVFKQVNTFLAPPYLSSPPKRLIWIRHSRDLLPATTL